MIDLNSLLQDPEALAALLGRVAEADLYSEIGRRRRAKLVHPSGGKVWSKHRPGYSRCRCRDCNVKRAAQ